MGLHGNVYVTPDEQGEVNFVDRGFTREHDKYVCEWEWIGEGNSGEYNPDDPYDTPRLRFSVYHKNGSESPEQLDDASYCTLMTPDTPDVYLELFAHNILDVVAGASFRRRLARLTWTTESELMEALSPF